MKTIVIAGGTGFLGQVLESYFSKKGFAIKILTRHPKKKNHIYWNAKDLDQWTNELEGIEILINLTGKSVDCRYNEENKKLKDLNSRETWSLIPLVAIVIWLGVYPKPVLTPIDNSVKALLSFMDEKAITQEAKDMIRVAKSSKEVN